MTAQKVLSDEAALEKLERREEFIAVRLAHMGITNNLGAAVMLARMRFLVHPVKPDKDGHRWTSQSYEEWWDQIRLWKYDQLAARKRLKSLGFIVEKEEPGRPTLFRVEWVKVLEAEQEFFDNGSYPPADRYLPPKRGKSGMGKKPPGNQLETSRDPAAGQPGNTQLRDSRDPAAGQPGTQLRDSRVPAAAQPPLLICIKEEEEDLRIRKDSLSRDLRRDEESGERDPKTFKQVFKGTLLPEELPGQPERSKPSPAKGKLDPRELVQQIWISYPKNSHLQPFEVPTAAIVQLLPILREEANTAGTTQTNAALEIMALIGEIAAAVKAQPGQEKYLPAPEKFFAQRQYRLKPQHFTRSNGGNDGHGTAQQSSPARARLDRSFDAIEQAARKFGLRVPAHEANESQLPESGISTGDGRIVDGKLVITDK